MSRPARALARAQDLDKWERVRRLRYGDFLRVFRARYYPKGYYHFPDDDAGRGDLWLIMLNQSLSAKEPEKKMLCILDVWAPWMTPEERKQYVAHVWGLDIYQRLMTGREIGDALRLTNAERERLKVWQFKPVDLDDDQLADQRRRKRNERKRVKRAKTRAEFLSSCLTAQKPWEAEGISRRTWYRKRGTTRGTNNSNCSGSIPVPTVQVESQQKGYHEGVLPSDVVRKRGKAREQDRNASGPSALVPRLVPTEQEENSKLLAALNKLKDGVHGR
jgi:hypothetical protein